MGNYEIVVEGHLNKKRYWMFEEMEISLLSNGRTRMCGGVDQSALHAILTRIRDMGLTLISVKKEEVK